MKKSNKINYRLSTNRLLKKTLQKKRNKLVSKNSMRGKMVGKLKMDLILKLFNENYNNQLIADRFLLNT